MTERTLETFRRKLGWVLILLLILANISVWIALGRRAPSSQLQVHFLNIGQGDAILIESPTHKRVLIDAGPNRSVLGELGRILPFGDRRIDVLMATHPDKDHIGGVPEVLRRYKVGIFLEPGVESENSIDDLIEVELEKRKIPNLLAKRGMILDIGGGVTLTVLFPSTDVTLWETNDASIVARLEYGEDTFLFTGDAGLKTENILSSLGKEILDVDVLKVGHHGSRTSTSLSFLDSVTPEYAVISAGRDNSYGHPHKEVLSNLEKAGAEVLSTIHLGTITFFSSGNGLSYK